MKNIFSTVLFSFFFFLFSFNAIGVELAAPNYLEAVISTETEIKTQKGQIFDATKSFIPNPELETTYEWDFGDGNKNQGAEVLHIYKNPGKYEVTLKITNEAGQSETKTEVFAYNKLLLLLTDQSEAKERVKINEDFAKQNGVFIKVIESFGSTTEFISEEVLTKKIRENQKNISKSDEIIIWTKENAGLNALSRVVQSEENKDLLREKNLLVIETDPESKIARLQRQFDLIKPRQITIAEEGAINALITSQNQETFIATLEERGNIYSILTAQSGKLRPWNFMQHFVRNMVESGIPDNTIALLLILPVIATVVAFMRQVVGITTFGIYTPSIITLSFLVIGISAGLLTLLTAIVVGSLSRPLLKPLRMLFIPKMAMVISLVSLVLFLVLMFSTYINLFDATFLSIAIFPMLILSTLVEKFVSVKSDKGLWSASFLMGETLLVSIIAYFIAGGEINLGIGTLKFDFLKDLLLTYPEFIILFLLANIALGKWTGLRLLERVRFRELLRHIEE